MIEWPVNVSKIYMPQRGSMMGIMEVRLQGVVGAIKAILISLEKSRWQLGRAPFARKGWCGLYRIM
jgi:hypothetical protein